MIKVSNTVEVKFIGGEYRRWLNLKAADIDTPMPGRSWQLIKEELTLEESQLLLERLNKEHL